MDHLPQKKLLTLCLWTRGDHVLLGYKKRGFGEGRWNGFGGKVESGESIAEAARREMYEEAGVHITQMEMRGVLSFFYTDEAKVHEVHLFHVTAAEGEPVETEEMRPQWFAWTDIPFGECWSDDAFWMPHFLRENIFVRSFGSMVNKKLFVTRYKRLQKIRSL